MPASKQLGLPPMALQVIGTAVPTDAKSVANRPEAQGPVDLCAIWIRAFHHHGLSKQQAAGLLDMTDSNFSKSFSKDWPNQNPTMKKLGDVDVSIIRTFTVFLAAELGMSIGSDSELMTAKAAFADAHLKLVEVASR